MNNELFLTELAKAMSVDGRVNVDAYSRVVRLIDDYTSINNSVNTPVSGSLPLSDADIEREADILYNRHYNDYHYYTADEGFKAGIKCGCWAMVIKLTGNDR